MQITLTKKQIKEIIEKNAEKPKPEPVSYSIIGTARFLGISKSKIWKLISDGEISKVTIGKSSRILTTEINRYLKN